MRVGFDVTARMSGFTGVARYGEQLQRALVERGVDVRPYALGRAVQRPPVGTKWVRVPLRVLDTAWHFGLPRGEWLLPDADVLHTDQVVPPGRCPSVLMVHDLDALQHPQLHARRNVQAQLSLLRSARRARVVIANSRTTALALARFGVPESRIAVVHLGATALPEVPAARFEAVDRYVLHVGSLHHRKGIDVLLRAWTDQRLADVVLVLAGPDDIAGDSLRALADELGVADRVRFEGRVDDERLASLYAGASAVCSPSRAEGFGLPLVEAFAAGTAVVASDIAAYREVAEDAAVLVPVEDAGALADALVTVLGDRDARDALVAAGSRRVGHFSWGTCASQTIAAYERALS